MIRALLTDPFVCEALSELTTTDPGAKNVLVVLTRFKITNLLAPIGLIGVVELRVDCVSFPQQINRIYTDQFVVPERLIIN